MKLSIIIPVYGVEKYIKDCILSCIENIGPTNNDVEVIVVDDGSKDRSIDIVRSLVKDYPYFRIIVQKNQGLSLARNNGFNEAKGDYVWFVDSDDIIASGVVNKILSTLDLYDTLDILELEYEKVDEFVDRNLLPPIDTSFDEKKVMTGRERFLSGFSTPAQFHVLRRDFLITNKLVFYPDIFHEDCEFTPRTLWKAERVALLSGVAYYYRQRRNSIVSTPNPQKGLDCIKVAGLLHSFFEMQNMDRETRSAVSNYISMIFCNGLYIVVNYPKETKKTINSKVKENRELLSELRHSRSSKYIILGYIASVFPMYTTSIYEFLIKFQIQRANS